MMVGIPVLELVLGSTARTGGRGNGGSRGMNSLDSAVVDAGTSCLPMLIPARSVTVARRQTAFYSRHSVVVRGNVYGKLPGFTSTRKRTRWQGDDVGQIKERSPGVQGCRWVPGRGLQVAHPAVNTPPGAGVSAPSAHPAAARHRAGQKPRNERMNGLTDLPTLIEVR